MGILGVLKEEFIDITTQKPNLIKKIEKTPSAGVMGSCRYKIKSEEDLERIVEVFKAHNIGYFFYCGGNDSMDTANKVSKLAKEKGLDLISVGIVKTIDNDLGGPLQEDGTFSICDHNPGYGSTARYTAINILQANQENKASYTSDPVLIIGVMGRKIGFIAASARLADPERKIPLLIILPEAFNKFSPEENLEYIREKVNDRLKQDGRCIIVISEGVNLGNLDILKDSFGHEQFSAAGKTVEQILANYLNGLDNKDEKGRAKSRIVKPGIARYERPGTHQRRDILTVSKVDLKEAYKVGVYAAKMALKGENGYMATILRKQGDKYRVIYDKIPLEIVANAERKFPENWISPDRVDVTDEFIKWAIPLIGNDFPEFVEFEEVYAEKKCPDYIPYGERKI